MAIGGIPIKTIPKSKRAGKDSGGKRKARSIEMAHIILP